MAGLDDLLTQALHELALDAPDLPPLSPRVRKRILLGRLRALLTGAVAIAGVSAAVVLGANAVTHAPRSQPAVPVVAPGWTAPGPGDVDAVAASRSELYVAAGHYPNATLSAFDVATGKLLGRVSVPGLPVALRVGPGGSVWLTFGVDQRGGRAGLWLLRADLGARSVVGASTANRLQLSDVLPLGPVDAAVADHGLVDVHMPVPGRGGRPTIRSIAPLRTDHGYARLVFVQAIVRLGRGFAVMESNNSARYRIVVAGRQGAVFDHQAYYYSPLTGRRVPGPGTAIDSVASVGHGLWIVLGTNDSPAGQVYYLNDQLKFATPLFILGSRKLAYAEQVWTAGSTVVVSTDVAARPLACLSDRNGPGQVTEIPARLPPTDVAVVGTDVYAADALGVIVYRLPAACR